MQLNVRTLAAIAAGGFVGTVARVHTAEYLVDDPGTWPWATLVANVVGALVLACLVAWPDKRLSHAQTSRPLVGPGFCGALTTFSTMQLEVLWMIDAGRVGLASAYTAMSVTLGLLAVYLAPRLVRAYAGESDVLV